MMQREKKISFLMFLVILGIIFSILFGLYLRITKAENDHQVFVCSNEIGRILILFVNDQKRMPSSWEELYALGYFSKNSEGLTFIGPKSSHREVEGLFSEVPSDWALICLDKVHIHFDGTFTDKDLFSVQYDKVTIRWSDMVTFYLQEMLKGKNPLNIQ